MPLLTGSAAPHLNTDSQAGRLLSSDVRCCQCGDCARVSLNVCTAFMKSAEPPAGQWLPSEVRARPAIAVSYMLEPINNVLYFSCILLWRHLCLFPTVHARHVQPFTPKNNHFAI